MMTASASVLLILLFVVLFMGAPIAFGLGFLSVLGVVLFLQPSQLAQLVNIVFTQRFDPIWLGVIITINVEIAMITPPVGLNLFVLKGISNVSMGNIMKGSAPYVLILILGMLILTLFPDIALFLPSTMK